ncbi:hypothetical protein J6590_005082 [Homalodisca vitripennis]|nr:hypothetical protein J6590_005082 [Homalodisca vitripennis]
MSKLDSVYFELLRLRNFIISSDEHDSRFQESNLKQCQIPDATQREGSTGTKRKCIQTLCTKLDLEETEVRNSKVLGQD